MNEHDGSDDVMSSPAPSEIDEFTAEALLDGRLGPDDVAADHRRLAGVLSAATSPVHDSEIVGEDDVLAMFRSVRGVDAPPTAATTAVVVDLEVRRNRRRVISRAAAFGVAAGIVLGGTGIAAAATGRLPDPVQTVVHDSLSHVGIDVPRPAPRPPAERPAPPSPPTTVAPSRPGASIPPGDRPANPPSTRPESTSPSDPPPTRPSPAPTPPPTERAPSAPIGGSTPPSTAPAAPRSRPSLG